MSGPKVTSAQRVSSGWSKLRHRSTGDEAAAALRSLERAHRHDSRRQENPNFGYRTPFDGGQYPGVDGYL